MTSTGNSPQSASAAIASEVQASGLCTRLQAIALPTDPKRFADLLADFVDRLGVAGKA
jgi:hypothetical protein